jgi:hypothetical protein
MQDAYRGRSQNRSNSYSQSHSKQTKSRKPTENIVHSEKHTDSKINLCRGSSITVFEANELVDTDDRAKLSFPSITQGQQPEGRRGVAEDKIDFVHDFGTEGNLSTYQGKDILCNEFSRKSTLQGVGGSVTTDTAGYGPFGLSTVLEDIGVQHLVSQFQAGEKHRILAQTNRFKISLVGWPGAPQEHITWGYYSDFDRQCDHLFHCTVKRYHIEELLSKFKTFITYSPKRAPEESELTADDRRRMDLVEHMQVDLSGEQGAEG